MTSINFSKFIENRIANIQASDSFAFAAAIGLGPWLVPLGPAIIFGYALYVSAPIDMAEFRLVTAIAIAIGLIVAGAVSSHNAIVSGGWRPWSLVMGYIALEIVGLWLMSVIFDVKIVGTVASLLTLIVYLSRSTAKEIDTGKAETKETNKTKMNFQIEQARLNAEHQRQMEQRAADLNHNEKMARIEAKIKGQGEVHLTPLDGSFAANDTKMNRKMNLLDLANDTRRLKKEDRLNRIKDLIEGHTQHEIADILNVSLSTVKRDIRELNGTIQEVK